jgi:hypothetical protein
MDTSGNGDGRPDGSPPGGLPGLPPEWGQVVVPDDPSALAAEAEVVRSQLRRARPHVQRRHRWTRLTPQRTRPSPAHLSLMIMSIAVLSTLASLLAAIWLGQPRPGGAPRTAPTPGPGQALPALDLVGEGGETVPLRALLPAMIILVDGCDCADEVDVAARAAPPGVTVIRLISGRPEPSPLPRQPTVVATTVRSLADPADELRQFLRLPPRSGAAGAVLVGRSGEIVLTLPVLTGPEAYQADLATLTGD